MMNFSPNNTTYEYQWLNSLHTAVTDDYLFTNVTEQQVEICLKARVLQNEDITCLDLFYLHDGDEIKLPLIKSSSDGYDNWQCKFLLPKTTDDNLFSYRFIVTTHRHQFFWGAAGFYKYSLSTLNNFKYYYSSRQPQWLENSVMYHIFIDRFDKSPSASHQNSLWGDKPDNTVEQFFGGDIKGIENKLDYLVDLGVNTLCLTPIFEALTNHKYDTQDYYNIARCFGGNEVFEQFIAACKKINMRVILDGVFNHVGADSQWFNRAELYNTVGAFQSEKSTYHDYFYFAQHPDKYAMFWQEKSLPKLNYQSQPLKDEIYQNDNSIVKHWLKGENKTDGWRLDACCMLGKHKQFQQNSQILTELYSSAKEQAPDSYIFGEHPFDPTEIIPFKHLDGITNYAGFYSPIRYWLNDNIDFSVTDFDHALKEFRVVMGYQFTLSSKTFLGNHDKPRLFTELNGDISKYLTALTFLFTYPGVPTLYYGEEIALASDYEMDNHNEGDSRLCMRWNDWSDINKEIIRQTKQLIQLYKSSLALKKGHFKTLYCKDEIIVYVRAYQDQCVIVVLSKNDKNCNQTLLINMDILGQYTSKKFTDFFQNKTFKVDKKNRLEVYVNSNNQPLILAHA